jgi:hypothetical protein
MNGSLVLLADTTHIKLFAALLFAVLAFGWVFTQWQYRSPNRD